MSWIDKLFRTGGGTGGNGDGSAAAARGGGAAQGKGQTARTASVTAAVWGGRRDLARGALLKLLQV